MRAGATAQGLFLSSPSNAYEAQEAEAIRILTSVLNIRESTSARAPQKTIFVLKTLVMLYHLMNSSKASFPIRNGRRSDLVFYSAVFYPIPLAVALRVSPHSKIVHMS
jgi:hypothetical protein